MTDRTDLSPVARERIEEVIHSLMDDQVERGVDLGRPMHCDSCDLEKSPLGSTQYGAYALCNDCLLEFALLLARGDVESVAEYMTRRPECGDGASRPAPDMLEARAVHSLPKRSEKLMPSNEPC